MTDTKLQQLLLAAHMKRWQIQDAADAVKSAVQKHPRHVAAQSAKFVADWVIVRPAHTALNFLVGGSKAVYELAPWATQQIQQGSAAAWRGGQQAVRAMRQPTVVGRPDALLTDTTHAALMAGLRRAQQRAQTLDEARPSVQINWKQYALHVGCMLPLKAAKLMGIAAIVHATPLGHMAIGHLLSPSSEEHVMALLHLSTPSEVGLAAGTILAVHHAFSSTLKNSNMRENTREKRVYAQAQNTSAAQLRTLRRALDTWEALQASAGEVAQADVARVQKGVALAGTLSPEHEAGAVEVESNDPLARALAASPSKTEASHASISQFVWSHPAKRASVASWAKIKRYYQARELRQEAKAQAYDRLATALQPAAANASLPPSQRTRIARRITKVRLKQELAQVRARRARVEQDMRTFDKPPEDHFAAYQATKDRARDLKKTYAVAKAMQNRASQYVQPAELDKSTAPGLVRLTGDVVFYSVAVVPLVNLPYWGALMTHTWISQRNLRSAMAKADNRLKKA